MANNMSYRETYLEGIRTARAKLALITDPERRMRAKSNLNWLILEFNRLFPRHKVRKEDEGDRGKMV